MTKKVRIASIFQSFNGEVTALHQGSLCTFIRLAGCNLRCKYCDTKYSQECNADTMHLTRMDLARKVFELPQRTARVTITGGEPLLQMDALEPVVDIFNILKIPVSVETNGTYIIPTKWFVHSWVVDCKLPGSGINPDLALRHYSDWVANLRDCDVIKFVVTNREDFEMAHELAKDLDRDRCRAAVAFSAASASIPDHVQLLNWMKEANLTHAILNVQLHKILFPNSGGGRENEV